jgi:hypothetical protein
MEESISRLRQMLIKHRDMVLSSEIFFNAKKFLSKSSKLILSTKGMTFNFCNQNYNIFFITIILYYFKNLI